MPARVVSHGGPYVVVDEGRNVDKLRVVTRVSGEVRQDWNTSEMMYSFAEVAAHLSHYLSLQPTDIITSGTGPGTAIEGGGDGNRWLKPGDKVEVEVEELMKPFRFGVNAWTAGSRAEWRDKVRRIEDLGYSVLTVPDHLAEIFAPIPALISAAEATQTLRVGTNVLNNDFRHPVLVAREAATADVLTDGRLQLGLGAGHMKSEYDEAACASMPEAPGLNGSRRRSPSSSVCSTVRR